jgi:nucleoside permease NupC
MTSTLPAQHETPAGVAAPVRTLGILSLVFGVAAIVTGFQLAFGVAAVVLGVLALRREPASRTLAIAGIVTGAVSWAGIVIGVGATLFFLPIGLFLGLPWIG